METSRKNFNLFQNTEPEPLRAEMEAFYKHPVKFVETYKDHMIFSMNYGKDGMDHMVVSPNGSVIQVGMDDSKSSGRRTFVSTTDEMARNYVDFVSPIKDKNLIPEPLPLSTNKNENIFSSVEKMLSYLQEKGYLIKEVDQSSPEFESLSSQIPNITSPGEKNTLLYVTSEGFDITRSNIKLLNDYDPICRYTIIQNNPNVSLKNQNVMERKDYRVGLASSHKFEANAEKNLPENTVFNLALFEKEFKSVLPKDAGSKFRVFLVESEKQPSSDDPKRKDSVSYDILTSKEGIENSKVALIMDFNVDTVLKGKENEKLKIDNHYINLTAAKIPGKDTYSIYQRNQENKSNLYVGFASEPFRGTHIGSVFSEKASTKEGVPFEYKSVAINPSRLDLEKNNFIVLMPHFDKSKQDAAFSVSKPILDVDYLIQLSKKGIEFLKSHSNDEKLHFNITARKQDSISEQMNFSDFNVVFFDKETKNNIFLGSAWSKEQLASLPDEIKQAIASNKTSSKEFAVGLEVGQPVVFKFEKDHYINTAVDMGLMPKPEAAGTIQHKNLDGSYRIESYVGTVTVQAKNVSSADSMEIFDRQNSYNAIKSEIDNSQKIGSPEKKQTPKVEKTKGAAKNEKVPTKEKSSSKSKPKAKENDLSI